MRHIDDGVFLENGLFSGLHHDGFRGINGPVFFRTFVSCWRLSYQSQLSWYGWFASEIDEMRVILSISMNSVEQ
jgi:hypothetical protein